MNVTKENAKGHSVHGGRDYYFCNLGCKNKFDANPEKYAAPNEVSLPVTAQSFKPLIIVFFYILITVVVVEGMHGNFSWMRAMGVYMAAFYLTFSLFKWINIDGFVQAYQTYDIIAQRWAPYGYVYATLEAIFGFAYILVPMSPVLNSMGFLLSVISMAGVYRVLREKRTVQCACLGTSFNLPMTKVTLIENLVMAVMSALMLLANASRFGG